jgi:leader peptidase (prepilin peptidase) / N-methyltransferase
MPFYVAPDELILIVVAVLGAVIGSFLNVVILRWPVMQERTWLSDSVNFLRELGARDDGSHEQQLAARMVAAAAPEPEFETFNMVVPRSRCPHCGHSIRAHQNIPILGWLILRGRCAQCAAGISIRYPIIELVTALLSVFIVWQFGTSLAGAGALILTWGLLAAAMIDADTMYLPDDITLPWLWLGLGVNSLGVFTSLDSAVYGAIAGYLSLWSVYWLFKLATGKEGMGYGDFKLLAMLGAWLGWEKLLLIILLSSLVGAVVGIVLMLIGGNARTKPMPFGPYLAGAGWLALVWGDDIMHTYLRVSGLGPS